MWEQYPRKRPLVHACLIIVLNHSTGTRMTYKEPFGFDGGHSPNVILSGEDEFVIKDPLGIVAEDG